MKLGYALPTDNPSSEACATAVKDWPWQYIIPTLTALVATVVWGAEYDWSLPQPLAIWIGTWVCMKIL